MRDGDASRNREAESRTVGHAASGAYAGGITPVEAIKNSCLRVRADAGAVIDHSHDVRAWRLAHHDLHRASRGRILDGVVEEVEQETIEQGAVAVKWRLRHVPELNRHAASLADLHHRTNGVVHEFLEIHRLGAQREMSSVGARKQKQIVHKSSKALPRLQHDVHRFPILSLCPMLTGERHLSFRTERRGWRAHFMRRIGHKTSLLFKRSFDAVQQLVEHACESHQLSAATDRETLVKILRRDFLGARGHRCDRRQAPLREQIRTKGCDQEQQRDCDDKECTNL